MYHSYAVCKRRGSRKNSSSRPSLTATLLNRRTGRFKHRLNRTNRAKCSGEKKDAPILWYVNVSTDEVASECNVFSIRSKTSPEVLEGGEFSPETDTPCLRHEDVISSRPESGRSIPGRIMPQPFLEKILETPS